MPHDLIDRNIFSAGIRDLVSAEIERVAGITFARPHVGVEVEHLAQPDNGREVDQPLVLKLWTQFLLGFTLRFARDCAEKAAGGFFQSFHRAIGKRVAFLAPKFPANVARHILGIEFQPIEHEARRLHNIVTNSVTGHPSNFVFSHNSVSFFSFSVDHGRNYEIRMTKPETNPNDEELSSPRGCRHVVE
jgi:hypothetical protein